MTKHEFLKCSEDFFWGAFKLIDEDSMGDCAYVLRLEEVADELWPGYINDLGLIYPITDISGHDIMMHYLTNKS